MILRRAQRQNGSRQYAPAVGLKCGPRFDMIGMVIEMIFTCDNCGFIFSRSEETEQCPDCGKYEVRPANEAEQEELAERIAPETGVR